MVNSNKKIIGVKVDKQLALELKVYCLKNNVTMSRLLEKLIKEFLEKNKE